MMIIRLSITFITFVSSANFRTVLSRFSSISLMYIRNRVGPKIEPCGTPLVTLFHPKYELLILTRCFLSISQVQLGPRYEGQLNPMAEPIFCEEPHRKPSQNQGRVHLYQALYQYNQSEVQSRAIG